MSVASEVARISASKEAIRSAIEGKGVQVPGTALLDEYAGYVEMIGSGGWAYRVVDPSMSQEEINQALEESRCVCFSPGTYHVSVPADDPDAWYGYRVHGNSDVLMVGAVFDMPEVNKDRSYAFVVNVSSHVRIHGSWEVVGDRSLRGETAPGEGEMQAAVYVATSSDVVIEGAIIHDMYGDGIVLDGQGEGSECRDVVIRGCEVYDCDRNGMALMNQVNCSVEGCYCHGMQGSDPAAGIDVEPYQHGVQKIQGVRIIGCVCEGNRGSGISVINQQDSIPCSAVVSDCVTDGIQVHAFGANSCISVSNCIIDSGDKPCMNLIPRSGNNVAFSGCTVSTSDAVMYTGEDEVPVQFPRLSGCVVSKASALIYYERYNDQSYLAYFDHLSLPQSLGEVVRLQTGEANGYVSGTVEQTSTQVTYENAEHNPAQNVLVNNADGCNVDVSRDAQWSVPFTVVNNAADALTLVGGTFFQGSGQAQEYLSVPSKSSVTLMYHPTVGAFVEV